jgi:WD40 repeat protein
LIYSSGLPNTAATLWRRRIEASASEPSQRIDGVEEGSLEPAITRGLQENPQRLAYERIVLDTNIWAKDVDQLPGSASRIVASTRRDANPQFSPDGRRLAFTSDRSGIRQIWVCNSDGSNPVQLTSFNTGFTNAPRWSPDGQHLVFGANINNNFDIYLISVDSGVLRRLTTEPTNEGRPSWSRDGRWIYFYSTRSGFNIFKMPAEGGNALQVTKGGGHECFESPDGKLLYYQFLYSGLRAISTGETGPSDGPVFLPTLWPGLWAVADKGIYFVELNEEGASPYRVGGPSVFTGWAAGSLKPSHTIQFYDFESRKVTQVGLIERQAFQPDLSRVTITRGA